MKEAYKINPSSVDRALGAMIKSADSNAQREHETNKMLAQNEVHLGIASPEQFQLWEQTYGLDKMSLGEMIGVDDNGQFVFNDNVRFAIEKDTCQQRSNRWQQALAMVRCTTETLWKKRFSCLSSQ